MVGCCSLTVLPVPLWGGFGKPASRRRGISRNPSAAPLKHFRDPIFFCWCAISSVHPWGDPKPEKMPGFARPSMRDGSPQAKPSPEVSALHPWGTAGSPETPCNLLQRSGGVFVAGNPLGRFATCRRAAPRRHVRSADRQTLSQLSDEPSMAALDALSGDPTPILDAIEELAATNERYLLLLI